jgi:hypothetical protein
LGSRIGYVWKVAARTTTEFFVAWDRREGMGRSNNLEVTFFEDKFRRIGGNINYELGLKTTLGSAVGFESSTGNDYDEFQASIFINREF